MNKKLIKKYKAEFDHLLYGGSVLVKYTELQNEESYEWIEDDTIFDNLEEALIIINDEFVEFRKAGAEGKQLQVSYPNSPHPTIWYDKSYHKISWSDNQLVRIKPESTIKVGDWLYDLQYKTYHRIENVLEDKIETNMFRVYKSSINGIDYSLWKPKPGEWCIVDNSENEDIHISFMVHQWQLDSKWTPIPYTGPMPHFIKEN